MDIITRSTLLYLVSFMVISLHLAQNTTHRKNEILSFTPKDDAARSKRGFIITKSKPGPMRQIFGIIYEQYNDTRSTWNMLNKLVNDQFLPENASLTTTTTPNPNVNISTKPPPYKITRSEFTRILRRNLKGLVRLYNIELKEAMKQSEITRKEYNRNVTREVAKFL